MNTEDIRSIVNAQRAFFLSGHTLDVGNRMEALSSLRDSIITHRVDIMRALQSDLGKCEEEAYMCEYGLLLSELSYVSRHMRSWARKKLCYTPLANQPAISYVKPSPRGTVLIMSPWNYPILLSLEPLIDAIAAGNTAVVKPSAYAPETSRVIEMIISDAFEPEYVTVITGGREENDALLDMHFDHIFFTGSQAVGREVMRRAAEYLTPVTLELGGKSPVIIGRSADIDLAARRIVWGKYLNCGQTCVAPDYILCPENLCDELIDSICDEITRQYGEDPLAEANYGYIINRKHFDRLQRLMAGQPIVFGGATDTTNLRIEPTVIYPCAKNSPIMHEEIFGPLLPIIPYKELGAELRELERKPQPLAFYVFSNDKRGIKELLSRMRFGGGCVNDVVFHLASSHMPFGGSGASGMGAYHGKVGFDTFSHHKAILQRVTKFDPPIRYRPFKEIWQKVVHLLLK